MIIGIPTEIKDQEYRVAAVPAGVRALAAKGHRLLVEGGAGIGSGLSDENFRESGAEIVDRKTLFAEAEIVVKVKEPLAEEFDLLHRGLGRG